MVNLEREGPKTVENPDVSRTEKGKLKSVLSSAEDTSLSREQDPLEKASEHRPHVCVPDVTTISDDDPDFLDEGRIDLKDLRSLDQGRMQDFEDSIDLLSIKIKDIGLVPFSDVRYD